MVAQEKCLLSTFVQFLFIDFMLKDEEQNQEH